MARLLMGTHEQELAGLCTGKHTGRHDNNILWPLSDPMTMARQVCLKGDYLISSSQISEKAGVFTNGRVLWFGMSYENRG